MYAVIKIGGSQYRVEEGQILEVNKLEKKPEETFEIKEVLLVADGQKAQIGQPLVLGVKIYAKVLEQFKGEKIRVARFKAKVRYRRVKGFRSLLTKIQITQIREKKVKAEDQSKADSFQTDKKVEKPAKTI